MKNKTIEIYNYEDETAKTQITINSLFKNDTISFEQIDIEDIKIFLKHGIFAIKGYIRHADDINGENILKLNKWCRTNGDKIEWLKRINIKIVRSGHVIREYIFNGFVADYIEFFNKGKHMFYVVIRQYKLQPLDGRGETGADSLSSYVGNIEIKDVSNELIILSMDWSKTLMSTSNLAATIGISQTIKHNPLSVSFILIAHTTGMITEFIADVYFVAKGTPDKMGSFNMTRDWFYKPLGKIISESINRKYPTVQLNKNLGEDIYNIGNLVFSVFDLGGKVINGYKALKNIKGEGILFTIKIKNVKVSHFGRELQPTKYIGLTPLKATVQFTKDMGLDIYATKEGFKSELEKREKSYPKINNIIMPKNTDIK
ncbi:hypothetical protein H3N56_03155 [Cetobacterium sp. 2A]|uniref:hypothetical protein n=1 Tax=Cetobacterium sp. 2A TaxID=2754723 RepID=UPI00163BBFDF|nr:hypothetical protein [Cetobacterium sp. 2A]MBC2855493.1 hypothetical protein [Cetobacterium sp. 2A]